MLTKEIRKRSRKAYSTTAIIIILMYQISGILSDERDTETDSRSKSRAHNGRSCGWSNDEHTG